METHRSKCPACNYSTCSCRSRCRHRGASSRPVHRSGFPLWTVQQVPDFPVGCDSIGFPRPKSVDSSRDGWSARALRAAPTRGAGLLSAPRRNESSLSINHELAMTVGMFGEVVVTLWHQLAAPVISTRFRQAMSDACWVCRHLQPAGTNCHIDSLDRMHHLMGRRRGPLGN